MPGGVLKETVTVKPHDGGVRGAVLSLDEVARTAWKNRIDPRVRAWSTQQLQKAGNPTSIRGKVAAIVSGYRKKVPYVPDPVKADFLAGARQLLCLDDHGLCIVGGDCDDAAATCAGCCLSIGINIHIVGASYADVVQPAHVYFEFQDEAGHWIPADATNGQDVGNVVSPARTWIIDPDKGVGAAGLAGGDFVGVNAPPRVAPPTCGDWGVLSYGGRLLCAAA